MDTEIVLNVKLEALDEGGFLATSPDLPGLVVQGRTRTETMELAQEAPVRSATSILA
jgi:predicted RNase H-like HicB family nuclease